MPYPRNASDFRKLADAYGALADAFNKLKGANYDVADYAAAKAADKEADKYLAMAVDAEWESNQLDPNGARFPLMAACRLTDSAASAQEFNDAQPRGWGGCGMVEV